MNRRAKRNKYKLTVRSLQNEISEYKKVFDHQRKFGNEKKVEVETLTCSVLSNGYCEEYSILPEATLKNKRQREVMKLFVETLMDRPDLLRKESCGSYDRFTLRVIKTEE